MKILFLLSFVVISNISLAQDRIDSIYTFTKLIVGKVKEVGHQDVLYTLPNEDVVYRIYKRAVLSITFSSGRKEIFNEKKDLLAVKTSKDWEKVELTTNPSEVEGLIKIDMVSVKATGATVYSSVTNTQDRAYRKMKHAAALMGGNVVLLNNQSVEGNVYSERTTRTQLTGTIYCSIPKDTLGLFSNILNKDFILVQKKSMGVNSTEPTLDYLGDYPMRIRLSGKEIFELKNGLIYLNFDLQQDVKKFILTYHGKESFAVAYQYKSRFVELIFKRKN
jgi:hypothetical protein